MKTRAALVVVALVATAAGCSGSDSGSTSSTAAVASTGAGGSSPSTEVGTDSSPTTMTNLLGRLPLSSLAGTVSDGATATIIVGDYDAASDLAGLERPAPADVDASIQWLVDLTVPKTIEAGGSAVAIVGSEFPRLQRPDDAVAIEEEFGFSPFAVDSYAALLAPPMQFAVLAGDLPLSADLIDSGGGIKSAGVGDDFQSDLEGSTAGRPIGQPFRFATSNGLVAVSLSTPVIEGWLAGTRTLLDDPAIAAAAAALDAGGSVAATLVVSSFEGAEDSPIQAPFSIVGAGVAMIDDNPGNIIVYVFDSAEDASTAVDAISNVWRNGSLAADSRAISDLFDVVSVEQSDRAVVVTTTVTDRGWTTFPYLMLVQRELVFTHG